MRGTIALLSGLFVCALAGDAAADSWYFEWHCQGACARGVASVNGIDGPFSSEADCDAAQGLDMTGDLPLSDPLNGTSAYLTAPTVLFQLSLLRRGADFAAY